MIATQLAQILGIELPDLAACAPTEQGRSDSARLARRSRRRKGLSGAVAQPTLNQRVNSNDISRQPEARDSRQDDRKRRCTAGWMTGQSKRRDSVQEGGRRSIRRCSPSGSCCRAGSQTKLGRTRVDTAIGAESAYDCQFQRSLHMSSRVLGALNPSSFSARAGFAVRSGTSPILRNQARTQS